MQRVSDDWEFTAKVRDALRYESEKTLIKEAEWSKGTVQLSMDARIVVSDDEDYYDEVRQAYIRSASTSE